MYKITWSQFNTCNPDSEKAFEHMCRSMFKRFFFDGNIILHSNPNNQGIEVLPALSPKSEKRISYQSKYFDAKVDYTQIKNSAEKIVKYYTGQLDIVYLYCNKDVDKRCKSYKAIEKLLSDANIELQAITNQEILNQLENMPVLVSLYFSQHNLTKEWFEKHLKASLESLGSRHNSLFNVDTKIDEYIDLFSLNNEAIERINDKKNEAIELLVEKHGYKENRCFLKTIRDFIKSIDDVDFYNLSDCLQWSSVFQEKVSDLIVNLKEKFIEKQSTIDGEDDSRQNYEIKFEASALQKLINVLPTLLVFDDSLQNLITNKVLIIKGEAGTGKSQLFANSAKKAVRSGGHALLLLGQNYISDQPIETQIMNDLGLGAVSPNIEELFNILEGIGERGNQCIVVHIDALNESHRKDIWRIRLNQISIKLEEYKYVRLAISVRTGYESLIFDDAINKKIEHRELTLIEHNGFKDDSVNAIKTFLDNYNIAFTPSLLLWNRMTNPLFLTLFCDTYDCNEKEPDIFSLFERFIKKIDEDAQKEINFDGQMPLVERLINQIAELFILNNRKYLTEDELLRLDFWGKYGIVNKIQFINALKRAGLLITNVWNGSEKYDLGYNLLEEFVYAKTIVRKYNSKEELSNYLRDELLKVENGKITKFENQDVFIVCCALFAEKYNEECINIIDELEDESQKREIAERYVESFSWRKPYAITSESFRKFLFLNQHNIEFETVWRVLIENSTKSSSVLNADFLHSILFDKPINLRDYIWTDVINEFVDNNDRIFQLIEMFESGRSLKDMSDDEIRLLLILFSWLLTSSNRTLRDKATKAMIEILRNNFELCKPLLKKFENVNDPYIVQRLYAAVFGAITKRSEKCETELGEIAEYVFETIFNQELVYTDILLRDYARLIIERWLYEFPKNISKIDVAKIKPPYHPIEIPIVSKEKCYKNETTNSGFNIICSSMKMGHMGGDFGNNVFKSALSRFEDVDIDNLYHYAMQYIRDELEYKDELFVSDYNNHRYRYYKNQRIQNERIGKKYQWIAFYNILARVSDTHMLKPECGENESRCYNGSWEPYVRDFDPTLNCHFLALPDLPCFNLSQKTITFVDNETLIVSSAINKWLEEPCEFFKTHASKLMFKDEDEKLWVALKQFKRIKNGKLDDIIWIDNTTQEIWSMSCGCIITQDMFEFLRDGADNKGFTVQRRIEERSAHQLFNREYAWSSGYESVFDSVWKDFVVATSEKTTVKYREVDVATLKILEVEREEEETKVIGRAMPTYARQLSATSNSATPEFLVGKRKSRNVRVSASILKRGSDGGETFKKSHLQNGARKPSQSVLR